MIGQMNGFQTDTPTDGRLDGWTEKGPKGRRDYGQDTHTHDWRLY